MGFSNPPSSESGLHQENLAKGVARSSKFAWLFWLLAIPVFIWAVREVPISDIAAALKPLRGWQLWLLVGINFGVIGLFSLRWWFFIRVLGGTVPFFRAVGYHLAGFGVSYFTVGPQVGGEPLQVMLVSQNNPVKLPAAISSVFLDKVFELLTNFTFLVFGAVLIFSQGRAINSGGVGWWAAAAVLLTMPLLHLLALHRGHYPLSQFFRRLPPWTWLRKVACVISQSEVLISRLLQEKPGVVLTATGISVAGWSLMFAEFLLILRFLGGSATFSHGFTAFMASQLAFLSPLPAGLGALEASQVMVFTSFGAPAALGLSVSLLMRARDLVFGLGGLAIAGAAMNKRSAHPRAIPLHEE